MRIFLIIMVLLLSAALVAGIMLYFKRGSQSISDVVTSAKSVFGGEKPLTVEESARLAVQGRG